MGGEFDDDFCHSDHSSLRRHVNLSLRFCRSSGLIHQYIPLDKVREVNIQLKISRFESVLIL